MPETKPLDDLLADLQRNRSTMAVVIDEYGRVAGIVTVEDIVEEVVGEIDDETDPAGGEVRRLANGDWFVRGHVAITDLADYGLDLPVDTDAYNSIGGFVFADRVVRIGVDGQIQPVISEVRDRHMPAHEPVPVGEATDLAARRIGLVVDLADDLLDDVLDRDDARHAAVLVDHDRHRGAAALRDRRAGHPAASSPAR